MTVAKPYQDYCYICAEPLEGAQQDAEHVIPANLFERGRKTKGLITLPAHKACNSGFSLDDEYFRLCVTALSAPYDEIAKKVWEGPTMRGFHRPEMPGLKIATLNSLHTVEVHTAGGLYLGTADVLFQEPGRIRRVVNRISRGLYAKRSGNVLSADWPVSSDLINPLTARPVFELLKMQLIKVGGGEFHYGWGHLKDDQEDGLFWMIFYHTVHFWGYIGTKVRDALNPSC
ncbi:MAG TPA: hypothetical protein VF179_19920 [Thermoanaerobaculia bacterium]|nr:hypothetical protein [Thermoanaerobaculia bacterium]